MNNWEIVANPPFILQLASNPSQIDALWERLKQQLLSGITLTGKIFARTHFGVFFDAGIGLPVRMNVTDFGKPNGGMVFPDDYPNLNSVISGQLAGFDEFWHQVVAWKGFASCMVPASHGVTLDSTFRANLWTKYFMAAPVRRRPCAKPSRPVPTA